LHPWYINEKYHPFLHDEDKSLYRRTGHQGNLCFALRLGFTQYLITNFADVDLFLTLLT